MLKRLLFRTQEEPLNIGEMMRRLDIDPCNDRLFNGGRAYNDARRACRVCHNVEDCTAWLAANTKVVEAAPPFCPNQTKLQVMRRSHS